jgi:general secretion pathway protein C
MQLPSFDRTASAQTTGVTLVTLAAAALFALAAAYWTWQWLAPRAATRAPTLPSAISNLTSASGLFGTAQQETGSAASAGIEIRLLGIMAATAGRNGYAVLRIEPRQIITVQEGKDIVPGIQLAAVGIDHVILERDGIRQTLSWPTTSKTAELPMPRIGK